MANKRLIKASEIESSGVNVEKVDYETRKFDDKVYKQSPLDETPVAIENQVELTEEQNSEDSSSDEQQVELERFYGDQGELTGLKITCRCGEVIELEFTREQDELPPDSELPIAPAQPATPDEQPESNIPDTPEPEKMESQ